MLCQMVKNYTIITCWHVESALILLEQGFVRAFQGSLQKGLTDFHDPIEWHRLHDAVGFNKTLVDLRGEGLFSVGGVKNRRFLFPAIDVCWGEVCREVTEPN